MRVPLARFFVVGVHDHAARASATLFNRLPFKPAKLSSMMRCVEGVG